MRVKTRRPSGRLADAQLHDLVRPVLVDALAAQADLPLTVAGASPEIVRSVVDLPAPLDPMRVTISPSSTVEADPAQGMDRPVVGVDVLELEECHRSSLLGCAAAEVGLDDSWVGADLGGAPFGDDLAVVEDRDAVADPHDDPHVVLDEQDGQARARRGGGG